MSSLIERQNCLLKTQLWCQLEDNTLKEWGSFLENEIYILNQKSLYDCCIPHSQNTQVQESRVEVGVAILTIIPTNPP